MVVADIVAEGDEPQAVEQERRTSTRRKGGEGELEGL